MELGSEFEIEFDGLIEVEDNVFQYLKDYHNIFTSSGRGAIRLLNQVLERGVILLPEYICESVIEAFEEKFEIRFYELSDNLTASIDSIEANIDNQVSTVYLMHYFGRLQPDSVLEYLQQKKRMCGFKIIEDSTHSIFTIPCTIGDYCVCSIRKWFPIPDGGVLYARDQIEEIETSHLSRNYANLKLEAMVLKKYSLKYDLNLNSIYRDIFVREEENFDKRYEIKLISDISESLLKCYSVLEMREKRIRNWKQLDEQKFFSEHSLLGSEYGYTPFTFPVYIDDRDDFRKYLTNQRIYCAVHWPFIPSFKGRRTEQIAAQILSFPIDQRYDWEHMEYLIKTVNDYQERQKYGIDINR